MKRFLLLAVFFLATAVYASAQYNTYYTVEEVGKEYPSLYKFQIDWNKKLFFLEGDGHNDGVIKNYKESGTTRTFDVYYDPSSGLNEKAYSVNFKSDGDDKYTMVLDMNGYKATYKLSTTEPVVNRGGVGKETVNDKINSKAKSIKNAIGKGVSKGLNALKKKDK